MRHAAPGLLDRLLHHVARALQVAQPGGEHRAERRVARQAIDHLGRQALALVDADHLVEQVRRDDPARAQADGALDDQGDGDDGSEEQEPDGPASGLDDREQRVSLIVILVLRRRLYAKGFRRSKFRSAANTSLRRSVKRGESATCSGYCDIHKNLWTSLWITAESRVTCPLQRLQSRLRSKFEQAFREE